MPSDTDRKARFQAAAKRRRANGRADYTGCSSCRRKALEKMKAQAGKKDKPAPLREFPGQPGLKIGAVVTAWNEGEWVKRTVESLLGSIQQADVRVFLVDDGSTDGSCDFAFGLKDVVLVQGIKPLGLGVSRNAGYHEARKWGADAVSFHDAHMLFPVKGGLEHLGARAVETGRIVCAGSRGITEGSQRLWACDLFYNLRDGLQPKWRDLKVPKEEWTRSPAPMGAGYVISRETADRLEAATGNLWDDIAGRWGFSEEGLGVKAYLLGVPVEFSRDVLIYHLYRKVNQVPDSGRQRRLNMTRCMAVMLSPGLFAERFAPICNALLGDDVVERITRSAWFDRPNGMDISREQCDRIFTHLCGKRTAIDEPHPDHAWLPEVEAAFADLAAGYVEGEGARILQWRPGESTFRLRRALPKAEVCAVELKGHRWENWRALAKAMRVKLECTLEDERYWKLPGQAAAFRARDGYDLVLVGGEVQEQCIRAARQWLRPGGQIICNPSADRMQIADEFRKDERKAVAKLTGRAKARRPKAPAKAPAKAGDKQAERESLVTVCLLNWRRPQNIPRILDCLAGQTVPLQVYLWTNAQRRLPRAVAHHPLVKLAARPAWENMGCFPRWWLASMSRTEYVCSMDDDLIFRDERVLEDAVAAHREECPDGIVGFFGWTDKGKPYKHASQHHNGTTKGTRCDIVKGRFMLLRREQLSRVPLVIPELDALPGLSHREDDIYLSLCISGGRPGAHLVPKRLGKRWKELPQHRTSAASEPGHYQRRDEAIRRVRAHLIKASADSADSADEQQQKTGETSRGAVVPSA